MLYAPWALGGLLHAGGALLGLNCNWIILCFGGHIVCFLEAIPAQNNRKAGRNAYPHPGIKT